MMQRVAIRFLGILLGFGSLTWVLLAFLVIGLDVRMDDSQAKLVTLFVLILLPPVAFLGLALLVRKLVTRQNLVAAERARMRRIFNLLGPIGAVFVIFQLTKVADGRSRADPGRTVSAPKTDHQ